MYIGVCTFAVLLDGFCVILLLEEAVAGRFVRLCFIGRRGLWTRRVRLVWRGCRSSSLLVVTSAVGDWDGKISLSRRSRRRCRGAVAGPVAGRRLLVDVH